MENDMYHVNINPNKDEATILIFDKVDFWQKKLGFRKFHFIMKKVNK